MYFILFFTFPILCICFFFLWRNGKVYKERMAVIDRVYTGTHEEIDRKRELYLRYSYNDMLYQFWKPVDSFYKDLI